MSAPDEHVDKVERQKAHFDSIAAHYATSRRHRNHLQLKELIWSHFLRGEHFQFSATPRVIEPMCGFADGKAILEKGLGRAVDYSGFDYSTSVVDDLKRDRPDLDVWQQDVTTFATDKHYDIAIILGGLHHVPHASADVVQRVAACLRPGGVFINLEPTHGNPLFKAVRERIYARNALFDEQTERAFSVAELRGMFEDAGLSEVDATWPGLLSYVLYYNPDAFGWLNVGTPAVVRGLFALERPFLRTGLARGLSFATLSVWRRPV